MIEMPFHEFWLSMEYWALSQHIGATWWFPLLNSLHVLGVTLMLGMLFMLDLRLMGLAATRYPVRVMSREMIPWTVAAFLVSVFTGLGMFITRASVHMQNPAFQWKLLLMLLAGCNMLLFHRRVFRRVDAWNSGTPTPPAARMAAALSLVLWAGVMLSGRWVGHIV